MSHSSMNIGQWKTSFHWTSFSSPMDEFFTKISFSLVWTTGFSPSRRIRRATSIRSRLHSLQTFLQETTSIRFDLILHFNSSHFGRQDNETIMLNRSANSSFVRETSGLTSDRLKTLLHQTSQRQSINRDKQLTRKRILFSIIFLCFVQLIV